MWQANELLCQSPSQKKKNCFRKVKPWTSNRQQKNHEKRKASYELVENHEKQQRSINTLNSYFSNIVTNVLPCKLSSKTQNAEMVQWNGFS